MATTFSLKVNGLDSLMRNLKNMDGNMKSKLNRAMVQATTTVQNEARAVKAGRFKSQTGNLRRSIQKRVVSPFRGLVFTDEKSYAPYVEFGTNPHVIYPKKKGMLAFKINGKMVFARKVNHPGSKPYPYMQPAFEHGKKEITKIYDNLAKELVKDLAK